MKQRLALKAGLVLGGAIAGAGLMGMAIAPGAIAGERLGEEASLLLAQGSVEGLLTGLPRPDGAPENLGTMFSANAYQQVALNFQMGGTPESAAGFYQSALAEAGYQEREINTAVEQWGFNLVFDLPDGVDLTPTDSSKDVVLVLQGTMLGPETINVNARYEEI